MTSRPKHSNTHGGINSLGIRDPKNKQNDLCKYKYFSNLWIPENVSSLCFSLGLKLASACFFNFMLPTQEPGNSTIPNQLYLLTLEGVWGVFLKEINQRNMNISLSSECLSLFKCILWKGNHARRRAETTRRAPRVFPRPFLVILKVRYSFLYFYIYFIQVLNGWVYFQYFTIKGSLSHQVPGLVPLAATS